MTDSTEQMRNSTIEEQFNLTIFQKTYSRFELFFTTCFNLRKVSNDKWELKIDKQHPQYSVSEQLLVRNKSIWIIINWHKNLPVGANITTTKKDERWCSQDMFLKTHLLPASLWDASGCHFHRCLMFSISPNTRPHFQYVSILLAPNLWTEHCKTWPTTPPI